MSRIPFWGFEQEFFRGMCVELQIPRLRRAFVSFAAWQEIRVRSVEKHSHDWSAEPQVPPLRSG
jgi:hypothetical protein